jgi:HK97 family phage prohead protease
MPYFITKDAEDCAGWAVVSMYEDQMEQYGCHLTKTAAIEQMVAISQEEGIEPGGELEIEDDMEEMQASAPVKLTAQVTIDAAAADGTPRRTISGIAVPYGQVATVNDGQKIRIEAGALPVDGKAPKLFLYHDATQPIGTVIARVDTDEGMLFQAKIAQTKLGDEALQLASEGVLDSVSVGINPKKFSWDGDVMVVKKADWMELSMVPIPAFAGAQITEIAASADIHQNEEQIRNTQEEPQESETPMDQQAPAVIEASNVQTVFAQPRAYKLPSPAEYIAAYVRGGHDFAQMNANIKAAAPDITTTDTPGILPEPIVGPVYDGLNAIRPFVSAIGTKAMPGAGATFRRPKITARPVVTQQPTGQNNPLDPSSVTVQNNDVSKLTFGTYVTISEQDLDWTDPASLNIVLDQLAIAYGQATDNYAVDQMVAGTTQTETIVDLSSSVDWVEAIYGAAYQISNGSNYLPTHFFCAPVTWAKLAMVTDNQDRPLFPFVGAPGLNGQNAIGTSSATSWNGNPLGLVMVVDKNMAGSTGAGGLNGVVGHAAGPAAGFEFYEQVKGAVSVEVPSVLGRTIAWRGYAATFMADATKFVKLLKS